MHNLHLLDLERALQESHRLLRPGGKLCVAFNTRCVAAAWHPGAFSHNLSRRSICCHMVWTVPGSLCPADSWLALSWLALLYSLA